MKQEEGSWNDLERHKYIYMSRLPYIVATQEIVRNSFRKYFTGDDKILQLGSGAGVLNGMVNKKYQHQLINTDLNYNPLTHIKARFEKPQITQANLIRLPFANNQFKQAVALSTFDVLTSKDMQKGASEIARVIEPGGIFIHFLDLLPDVTAFMRNYIKNKKVPFIIYESGHARLAIVDRKKLISAVEGTQLRSAISKIMSESDAADKITNLLKKYINDPVKAVLSMSSDFISGTELQKSLLQIIKFLKLNYELTEPVVDIFGINFTNALKGAGFGDLTVGKESLRMVVPKKCLLCMESTELTQTIFITMSAIL